MAERKMARRSTTNLIAYLVGAAMPALITGGLALAGSDVAVLNVAVNVLGRARIEQVGNLAFTNYDSTEVTNPNDAASTLTVLATRGLPYKIHVSDNRTLTNGSQTLTYQLYTDPARTTVWGSTLATAPTFTSSGNAPFSPTLYGRIPTLQDVPGGNYAGTATVTLEW